MGDNPQLEIEVMSAVATALQRLTDDADARRRVLDWACSAFLPADARPTGQPAPTAATVEGHGTVRPRSFETLPDLYSSVSPNSDAERALVVGYWFQVINGNQDLDGFQINKELRHLGHAASNITNALSSLIQRKPQLVIQTRKSGSSKQARKLYRLTDAGVKAVERMISGEAI